MDNRVAHLVAAIDCAQDSIVQRGRDSQLTIENCIAGLDTVAEEGVVAEGRRWRVGDLIEAGSTRG